MKYCIYCFLVVFSFVLTTGCSSLPKLTPKEKEALNQKSFYYDLIKKNSLSCQITTNILAAAARTNLKAQVIDYDEADSLERLKLNVQFSSESIDSVDFQTPNLKPFKKEMARYKLDPLVDATIKMINLDLTIINTTLMMPVLEKEQTHRIQKQTTEYIDLLPRRSGEKYVYRVYKDMSRITFDAESKAGRSELMFDKQDGYNFRTKYSILNEGKEAAANYLFFYNTKTQPPEPERIIVEKVDFDLRIAYSYDFIDCKL